ncbi:hypothetical protein ACFSHR_07345 [Azotobacter chroococcum]
MDGVGDFQHGGLGRGSGEQDNRPLQKQVIEICSITLEGLRRTRHPLRDILQQPHRWSEKMPATVITSVTGIVLFQAPLFWKSVFTYSLTFGAESFHVWHLDKSLQLLRHEWRIEFKHEALREV